MAIVRCIECSHSRDLGPDYLGKVVKCPHCKATNMAIRCSGHRVTI